MPKLLKKTKLSFFNEVHDEVTEDKAHFVRISFYFDNGTDNHHAQFPINVDKLSLAYSLRDLAYLIERSK